MRTRRPRGLSAPLVLTRYLGAAALLAVGADHLDQYAGAHYDAVPTIGTLFVLNFVSATLVAAALAAPVERLSRRAGRTTLDALALGGIGIAARITRRAADQRTREPVRLHGIRLSRRDRALDRASRSRRSSCWRGSSPCQTRHNPLSSIVDVRPPPPTTTPRSRGTRSWRPSGPAGRPRSGK